MPPCPQSPATSTFERNLRAGIGLCATAEDLFLLGITLRRSCRSCLLSSSGFQEVMIDQLAVHFPAAVPSFLEKPPATDFASHGLSLAGRGFAGYHLKGGWLLAHGGLEGYLGQNVLVQTNANASSVLVSLGFEILSALTARFRTWISRATASAELQAIAKAVLVGFINAPQTFSAGDTWGVATTSPVPSTTPNSSKPGLPCELSREVLAVPSDCQLPLQQHEDPGQPWLLLLVKER
eukprot:s3049_g4.t1